MFRTNMKMMEYWMIYLRKNRGTNLTKMSNLKFEIAWVIFKISKKTTDHNPKKKNKG